MRVGVKRTYVQDGSMVRVLSKRQRRRGTRKTMGISRYPIKASSFITPSHVTPTLPRQFSRFTYAQNGITIDPGVAGVAGVHVWSLNSLFDPDRTGVGHQPAGFDEMMSVYEHYTVYGVKYRVSWYSVDTTNEMLGGVSVNDSVTAQSDPRVYMENGQTQWAVAANKNNNGDRIRNFSGYIDLAKVHGHKRDTYLDESQYQGSASANPGDEAFLHCWVAPANATSDLSTSVWVVELQYYVMLAGGKFKQLS